jgi:hypothetical protein
MGIYHPARSVHKDVYGAIWHRPDYDDAYVNLAAALNREGRFGEAATLLEQRLGHPEDRADAHFNLRSI